MTIIRVLTVTGLACLALITLVSPGATRMFAWPWTLALAASLTAPALVLIARAFDRQRPLAIPSRGWMALGLGSLFTVLLSALVSPYRALCVLWSASLLAGIVVFFALFDWVHRDPTAAEAKRTILRGALLLSFTVIASVSMTSWLLKVAEVGFRGALAARNAFPLGHSNYTAGLALLMLPLGVSETTRRRGVWRLIAAFLSTLALAMLFSSGSRGGLLGLAILAVTALWTAPFSPKRKWQFTLAGMFAAAAFVLANPRIRATFIRGTDRDLVAASDVQRSAMVVAGSRMGRDRPLVGWGPGTTPLVFPRYRSGLRGGAENVLQLHSAPVQVWAELGLAGLLCAVGFAALVVRDWRRDMVAAITLTGYGAFAFTDWQLDVPIIAAFAASFAALLAAPCRRHPSESKPILAPGRVLGSFALGALAIIALLGRRDPTPGLNVQALAFATDSNRREHAVALLRESLALNPDQEIANFNLGWLLVVQDPPAAEHHFHAAAHLVPDKGGVYFGLGLAQLNQGKRDLAARAFALECLNDPAFLASPWWREPAIAQMRDASAAVLAQFLSAPEVEKWPPGFTAAQLGRVPEGPERSYRRSRTGYPVLMRNLDLPAPVDLYDVRESAAPRDAMPPLPAKGWLPSPFLLALLDAPVSPKP